MEKQKFIEELFKKRSKFEHADQAEMLANLLDTVSSDIYSESQRFIFELIQNADDASLDGSNMIHFNFYPDRLVVSHKGKPFDEADINSITHAGKGTKDADITKTGYKGIGFKSVFGRSNRVIICSDGYCFRFDKEATKRLFPEIKMPWQIIPIWSDIDELVSVFKGDFYPDDYSVSTIIELKKAFNLKNDLFELLSDGKILLFLRAITKISIYDQGSGLYSIEKRITESGKSHSEVRLIKDNNEISGWIVKTYEKIHIDSKTQASLQRDEKTPEKLKESAYAEISFAAKVDNGKLQQISGEESLIFTYLPTKVTDYEFPFLVNAGFLTTASRERIHEDRIWNQWLLGVIGEKIIDWLKLLSNSTYKYQTLVLLPKKFNSINNQLKICFDTKFASAACSKEFVLNVDNKLKMASQILVDTTGLSGEEFISNETIIDYVNQNNNRELDSNALIHPNVLASWKLKPFGSFFFELDNLLYFFDSDVFKSNHKLEHNHLLIYFFFRESEKNNDPEWLDMIRRVPFIFARRKILRPPCNVCFPSKGELSELEKKVKTIHTKVYDKIKNDKRIINWLIKLGVHEVSEIKWLENEIIPQMSYMEYKDKHLDLTHSIFTLHQKGLLEDWHYSKLYSFKLLCKNNNFTEANECYLSDFYLPELKLESRLRPWLFVSEDYCLKLGIDKTEFKHFLISINVSEDISFVVYSDDIEWDIAGNFDYREVFVHNEYNDKSNNWPHHDGGMYSDSHAFRNFLHLRFIASSKSSLDFSKLFWNHVISKYDEYDGINKDVILIHGYRRNKRVLVKNYVQWFIETQNCFPTSTKELLQGKEVFINDKEVKFMCGNYLPVLDIGTPVNSFWIKTLKLKTLLDLKDLLFLLERLSEEEDVTKMMIDRIAAIYLYLISKITSFTVKEKKMIQNWAKNNMLLSASHNFEKCSDLLWINKMEALGNIDNLKIIYIPDNLSKSGAIIKEFLELLDVSVINKVIPNISQEQPDWSFKIQLYSILPYLTALLEKNQLSEYSSEYNRLSSVVDKINFYRASGINLSFNIKNKTIIGPSVQTYSSNHKLYYKGAWNDPITLYSLIPELATLLEIESIKEEFRLLIQLDEDQTRQWLILSGYDIESVIGKPEYSDALKKVESLSTFTGDGEEDIPDSVIKGDHSSEKSRISISDEAKEIILQELIEKGFNVPKDIKIRYTIIDGVSNPQGQPVKLVVKSAKAGSIYFNPNEWLALTGADTQLFVVTRGSVVRNVTLNDLTAINDTFHMRFNTEAFAVKTNLKAFAGFFRYLPFTHFIFDAPESTSDFLQQFGLNERNPSTKELSADDKKLLK
jgi:hypothetical protein